jgi:hypothetical protein
MDENLLLTHAISSLDLLLLNQLVAPQMEAFVGLPYLVWGVEEEACLPFLEVEEGERLRPLVAAVDLA